MPSFQATIRQIDRETPDTVTLWLEPSERHDYLAGQFLNVDPHAVAATAGLARTLEAQKGRKERPRPYSLASAPHEPLLAITVKEEPPGPYPALLSPWLVHRAQVGDVLSCSGFSGFYTLPDELPAHTHLVHLCAGSGIVPNFGLIKDALHRGLPQRHTLLYSARTWDDVIYRQALVELAAAHPDRLEVVFALTRDPTAPEGVTVWPGRIGQAEVHRGAPSLEHALFFVCGPSVTQHERREARARGETPAPKFLECLREMLSGMGVPRQQVHYEGW